MCNKDQKEIRHHRMDQNWIPFDSSATRNSIGATIGEVSMLLSPETFQLATQKPSAATLCLLHSLGIQEPQLYFLLVLQIAAQMKI